MLEVDDLEDRKEEVITDQDRIQHALKEIRSGESHIFGYNLKITTTTVCVARDPHCRSCGKGVDKIVVANGYSSVCEHFKFFTGDDVNLTKDHIIPVSKGGTAHSLNLQTLCYFCNEEKDDEFNGQIRKVLGAKHVRQILNEVGRPDLITLMVDKIKKRKEQNHPYPSIFEIEEFLREFPIFTRERLYTLMKKLDGAFYELPERSLEVEFG